MSAPTVMVEIFKAYGTWYAVPSNNRAPLRQRCPIAWDVDLEKVLAFLENLRIFGNSIRNVGEIQITEVSQ